MRVIGGKVAGGKGMLQGFLIELSVLGRIGKRSLEVSVRFGALSQNQ